jgi:hypothetical protein
VRALEDVEAICPLCENRYHPWDDAPFCEDCELSDCVICGQAVNRPSLSEDLLCWECDDGLAGCMSILPDCDLSS